MKAILIIEDDQTIFERDVKALIDKRSVLVDEMETILTTKEFDY
ncbi:hypothetical protein A8990_104126 [Paenibacillus taihuensis]|uniref:Uncharacterized protein n=1 Tax=Paenibacillus taihuensis TaxID=1156355 RepID=A0A3D9SIA9_9BACL|nr:hypothetical protein [Paenibacillus taihuensis]REE91618.1 hypothetical protein A8990_104126 [Paenibacillus taihuensis]